MELNSRGEVLSLTDTYTRHTRRYRENQPELGVRRLLDGVNAFILHLGVLQQCFRGGDWLLDVNLPGPKLVSQGASGFRNWHHICGAVV